MAETRVSTKCQILDGEVRIVETRVDLGRPRSVVASVCVQQKPITTQEHSIRLSAALFISRHRLAAIPPWIIPIYPDG